MGGAGVVNNDGSVQSTVSANTLAGQSIVSFVGTSNASDNVGTGLPTTDMQILKSRDVVRDWWVNHKDITGNLQLNSSSANITGPGSGGYLTPLVAGNNGLIEFTAGSSNVVNVNGSGETIIAHCFHSVEGYSKFTSYVGNGSTDGTFVYLGFKAVYVRIKRTDGTGPWLIYDTVRGTINPVDPVLEANTSNAEFSYPYIDIVSNGIKIRGSSGDTAINANSGNYTIEAFAEVPFKYANAA